MILKWFNNGWIYELRSFWLGHMTSSWMCVMSSICLPCEAPLVVSTYLPSYSQMEFIDISQLSFIHDLGPKGL